MIVNSSGGSSGGGGLDLIYVSLSVYDKVTLSSPGKLAIVTTNVLNNSGAVMVVPGTSKGFGQLPSDHGTVSFSSNGKTITLPGAVLCSVAVFG